jgi:TATA-binding protein-associated factor
MLHSSSPLTVSYQSLYQPHIVITSFGLVSSAPDEFIPTDNRENFWDYVVLDEGHTIKNHKARVSQNCRKIGADERTRLLLLTGTPIMNRLDELWALVDFVAKSNVFPALHK